MPSRTRVKKYISLLRSGIDTKSYTLKTVSGNYALGSTPEIWNALSLYAYLSIFRYACCHVQRFGRDVKFANLYLPPAWHWCLRRLSLNKTFRRSEPSEPSLNLEPHAGQLSRHVSKSIKIMTFTKLRLWNSKTNRLLELCTIHHQLLFHHKMIPSFFRKRHF